MKRFMLLHYGFEAEDLDEAERVARENPHIASIGVYEIREGP